MSNIYDKLKNVDFLVSVQIKYPRVSNRYSYYNGLRLFGKQILKPKFVDNFLFEERSEEEILSNNMFVKDGAVFIKCSLTLKFVNDEETIYGEVETCKHIYDQLKSHLKNRAEIAGNQLNIFLKDEASNN